MVPEPSDQTRRRVLAGIGTGLAVGLAGCSGDGGDAPETTESMETMETTESSGMTTTDGGSMETASVRVAHLSPNAPNVDVYVDGSAVLEDVAFTTVSSYLEVPAGDRQVEITAAGDQSTSVFDGTVTVAAGTAYTIAAIGEMGDMADQPFEPLILEDDLSDVGGDTARLRGVHAAPDAPAVDITANSADTVLFDGVTYGSAGTVEVAANDYTVQFRGDTESNDGDVVADFDVSLNGGTAYTAFAVGYLTPDDEPVDESFNLVVAQDTGGMSG